MPRNPDEVGAIWRKDGAKGEYLSISLNIDALLTALGGVHDKATLVAFVNDRKTPSSNQPDYRILISRSREQREMTRPAVPVTESELPPELTDDDIPF